MTPFSRWSINCRLFVVQLVLAFLLYCLHNVAREMQQERMQRNGAHSDNLDAGNRMGQDYGIDVNRGLLRRANSDQFNGEADLKTKLTATERFRRTGPKGCPSVRRPSKSTVVSLSSGTWLKLDGRATIYVYSAFHVTRPDDNGGQSDGKESPHSTRLRVLVVSAVSDVTPVHCLVWYSGIDRPVVVEGRVERLDQADDDTTHQSGFRAYSIVCSLQPPIPDDLVAGGRGAKMVLEYVTLSSGSECPENGVGIVSFTVPEVEPVQYVLANGGRSNLAICVAPTSRKSLEAWSMSRDHKNQLHAPWFIEWMELLTMFGAAQVTMYTTYQSLDELSAKSLLDFYSKRNSPTKLVIRPLQLPVTEGSGPGLGLEADRDRPSAALAAIAFNDCILRFSHDPNVHYVAPSIGADEIVVPRQKSLNYSSMLGRLDASPKRALLTLRGATFSTDAANMIEDSFLTTVRFRLRDRMAPSDRHLIDPQRCAAVSSSGKCIELISNEPVENADVFIVPPATGAWHYYRACGQGRGVREPCAVDKDFAMMRFQNQLKLNIVQAMKDSGAIKTMEDIHEVALRL